jgi:hypothetical protein
MQKTLHCEPHGFWEFGEAVVCDGGADPNHDPVR